MTQNLLMQPTPFPQGIASNMDEASKLGIIEELRFRQQRLGTTEEQPEDQQRVCNLAHLLKNRLLVETLRAAMQTRGVFQPSFRQQ
jgi:hypothetical protein